PRRPAPARGRPLAPRPLPEARHALRAPNPVVNHHGPGDGSNEAAHAAAVMNAVGPQRAGLGSAMTNTSREVGGVFGIALLGTILTTKLKGTFAPALATLGLPATQQAAIAASAGHGTLEPAVPKGLPSDQMVAVQRVFAQSFMDGFHRARLARG